MSLTDWIKGARPKQPRGIRNNNPGNIRKTYTQWLGKVPGNDPAFETFDSAENGVRAMAKILLNYYRSKRLQNIQDIINRWAPPTENDTESYIRAVTAETGLPRHVDLQLETNEDNLARLVKAIIQHENGSQPYSEQTIQTGIDRALG
jgi:hypothetical protein